MTDIGVAPTKPETESIKIDLGGKISQVRVGVCIPYKKTAAFTTPISSLSQSNSKA